MKMDGITIKKGDSVFSRCYGAGRVTGIASGFLTVNFGGKTFNFNDKFVRNKAVVRELFWHDPVITPPPKESKAWDILKQIYRSSAQIMNNMGVE